MNLDLTILNMIKAAIVGICASAPIGPIAVFVIQQSLSKGHKAGFITGLGATLVDTIFACLAIFALAFSQDFLDKHREFLLVFGGLVVLIIGIIMALSNPIADDDRRKRGNERLEKLSKKSRITVQDFVKAVLMGITNPGGILVIFTFFTVLGIDTTHSDNWTAAPIILSVAAGTVVYWFFFSWGISHFRKYVKIRTLIWITRITGSIIAVLGVALLGEGLYRVMFTGAQLF